MPNYPDGSCISSFSTKRSNACKLPGSRNEQQPLQWTAKHYSKSVVPLGFECTKLIRFILKFQAILSFDMKIDSAHHILDMFFQVSYLIFPRIIELNMQMLTFDFPYFSAKQRYRTCHLVRNNINHE